MNEIRKKQYELEALADLVSNIENMMSWYQHEDEEGNRVDDDSENSKLHLAAYRSIIKSLLKLAGC